MSEVINYEALVWMQVIKDKDGKEFYNMGPIANEGMENMIAVTPVGGNGGTMFFCKTHKVAFGLRGACLDCRNAPRDVENR